jgi:radical SAM protein with 4Fe4S-binding SPASM domain
MRLNHFVFEDQESIVNITTKKALPKNSTEDELKSNFFLEGQEQASVDHFLFGSEKKGFAIDIIPTWECNLRCNHCFVLHELRKKDSRRLDQDLLLRFIENLVSEYPSISSGSINFIGGEPSLRSDENVEIIERLSSLKHIKVGFSTTSNGTVCDEKSLRFFSTLDRIIISLDGPESTHNAQRKPLDSDKNPFLLTVRTINTLASMGMRDKLMVQASLQEDVTTKENLVELYKILLMNGVKFENITTGFICPTKHNPKLDDEFVSIHRRFARARPCCKYRFMNKFVVDNSNNVYCDYFDANGSNMLGSLSDPISKIAENHERIIRESFSVLNDPKCKKCPVIGLCWGWCANTKGLNPSDYCDQELLIRKAKENAAKGNLVNFLKNTRKNDLSCGGENEVCCNKPGLAG